MAPPLYSSLIDRDQSHVYGHKRGRATRCPALCWRGQSRIFITFYTSRKLRRCPALLLTVRLDYLFIFEMRLL